MAMIWKWLYQPVYGLLNQMLKAVALPQIGFLTSPRWAMPSLVTIGASDHRAYWAKWSIESSGPASGCSDRFKAMTTLNIAET